VFRVDSRSGNRGSLIRNYNAKRMDEIRTSRRAEHFFTGFPSDPPLGFRANISPNTIVTITLLYALYVSPGLINYNKPIQIQRDCLSSARSNNDPATCTHDIRGPTVTDILRATYDKTRNPRSYNSDFSPYDG